MRISLAVVIALVTTASAAPPSRTLERAIKLYDRKDFQSAHIELHKVISGETSDDDANKQRAQFFVAKTLYHLDMHAAALAAFEQITSKGQQHTYFVAALKWYAALADRLPIDIHPIGRYPASALDAPIVSGVRDELLYRRGVIAMTRGDHAVATRELAKIARTSSVHARARLALGFVQVRTANTAAALATFSAIPSGDDVGDLAALAAGQLHARAGAWDKAIAAYTRVRATGPLGSRAAWETSWARLEQQKRAPVVLRPFATTPMVGLDAPAPPVLATVIAHDYCAKRAPSPDALAGFRAQAAATLAELAKLVGTTTDHVELYELVMRLRTRSSGVSPGVLVLVRAALEEPAVKRQLAWVGELARELAALAKTDRAYQTTMAAAEVLQELAVQKSVAEADAGKLLRTRLESLQQDLAKLSSHAKIRIAAGGAGGLAVSCP